METPDPDLPKLYGRGSMKPVRRLAVLFCAAGLFCASPPSADSKMAGRTVTAVLLPIIVTKHFTPIMVAEFEENIIEAIDDTDGFRVVPMEKFRATFPKIKTARYFDENRYAEMREKLGADLIVKVNLYGNRVVRSITYGGETRIRKLLIPRIILSTHSTYSGTPIVPGSGWKAGEMKVKDGRMQLRKGQSLAEFIESTLKSPAHQTFLLSRCHTSRFQRDLRAMWKKRIQSKASSGGFQYARSNEAGSFIVETTKKRHFPYMLHRPPAYGRTGWSYPLLIYLHGTGAATDTISTRMLSQSPINRIMPYRIGGRASPARLRRLNRYLKSSFVLLPQSPRTPDTGWDFDKLSELIAYVVDTYPVDVRRIYVTGISLGGFSSWSLARFLPGRFAAVVPVCGGICGRGKTCVGATKVWGIHSIDDRQVLIGGQLNCLRGMVKGPWGYGDVDFMATYPFPGRKAIFLRSPIKRESQWRLYAQPNPGKDYTVHFTPDGISKWKPGMQKPAKHEHGFTVFARKGHCPWPYGDAGLWKWIYAQRLPN